MQKLANIEFFESLDNNTPQQNEINVFNDNDIDNWRPFSIESWNVDYTPLMDKFITELADGWWADECNKSYAYFNMIKMMNLNIDTFIYKYKEKISQDDLNTLNKIKADATNEQSECEDRLSNCHRALSNICKRMNKPDAKKWYEQAQKIIKSYLS